MPYLRISCPQLSTEKQQAIAERLTDEINALFFDPRSGTREALRERTTVHFFPYKAGELFVGARTPEARGRLDLTAELSDWNMSVRHQRRIAAALTPALAELFGVPKGEMDGVNIRFYSYSPTDFSVGGRLLADRVPRIGRLMKRLGG